MRDMQLTDAEIAQRKRFLEFDDADVERLGELNELAVEYAEPVIEDVYRHLLSFEETASFLRDPEVLQHVKRMQRAYFLRLTQGDYNAAYVEDRLRIGAAHERIGLPIKSYLGMYMFYLRTVATRLREHFAEDPDRFVEAYHSLMKLVFMDIGLAIETYTYQREKTIAVQQEAIRELSTPVLRVRDRLLVLPIIGALDTVRARQLTAGLLEAIGGARARVVILDVTGVPAIDTAVANSLMQTVDAAQLMGARVIVTGLSAQVSETLVTLGLDLAKLNAVGDLQGGIEEAERILGIRTVEVRRGIEWAEDGDGRSDP